MYADADKDKNISIMLMSRDEATKLLAEISTLKTTCRDYQYYSALQELSNHLIEGLKLSR